MKHLIYVLALALGTLISSTSECAFEVRQDIVDLLKPKLNSDRIEYFFGSFGVDPLNIESPVFPFTRIANLHSIHDGKKIMRTLAVVDYVQPVYADLQDVHREIQKGKAIGIALRDAGYTIHKHPVYFGEITLSASVREWMDEPGHLAAVHIYRLEVSKNSSLGIPYCTIIEVHSPQYLTKEWLRALYDDQFIEANPEDLLTRLSILIEDFPYPKKI